MLKAEPVAVIVSDIHYSLPTLELADKAMRMAIDKANELAVSLVVAGDLHDTKANLRGECLNAMLLTFEACEISPYVLVGNHDRINERGEAHSLNFLRRDVIIVDEPMDMPLTGAHGVPYYHDPDELRTYLKTLPKGSTLIMHQGLESSNAGHYIQDKSAIRPEDVQDFRVISGHYHTRQDIKTGRHRKGAVGLWSYIGNPYTLNYAEAYDPPKGFRILMSDGSLQFVPTNLRSHVVLETTVSELYDVKVPFQAPRQGDLLWVKLSGSREDLLKIDRAEVAEVLGLTYPFRLDSIPTDTVIERPSQDLSQPELLDHLIDSASNTSADRVARLKVLWKNLCE